MRDKAFIPLVKAIEAKLAGDTPSLRNSEPRYAIFKIKDIKAYCPALISAVVEVGRLTTRGRLADGRPVLNALVIERDWPEYDLAWDALEARISGTPVESPPAWKDHQTAELVNALTAVARSAGQTQQLRERIRDALAPAIAALTGKP